MSDTPNETEEPTADPEVGSYANDNGDPPWQAVLAESYSEAAPE